MTAPHKALPAEVQKRLQQAAKTENTPRDRMARAKAIDAVYAWAKRQYPEFFK
jgi:hypothetical protein